MPDIFSPEKRSEIMSKIRGKNTGPEKIAFKFLRENKIYFQRHYKRVCGHPDIAFPRKKKLIFIDGNFWHGHNFDVRRERLLKSEKYYWIEKIETNMKRDAIQQAELEAAGWKILRIWEHRLVTKKYRQEAFDEMLAFIQS